MGIDAIALLRISGLAPVKDDIGANLRVEHRGNASLLSLYVRHKTPPDELSAIVYNLLGPALDAHDDPRGIFFFPDVAEPQAQTYEGLIREIGDAGVWGPRVKGDHVPVRYSEAASGTREHFVAEMIKALGREAAMEIDFMAGVYCMQMLPPLNAASAAAEYEGLMAKAAAGVADIKAYDAAVRESVAAEIERTLDAQRRAVALGDTSAGGQGVLSQAQMDAVFQDPRVQDILKKL